MATIEQLSAALVKADAAGNTADAKVFADALRAMKAQQPANDEQPPAGAVPGSREYADWAAAQARAGQALPQATAIHGAAPVANGATPNPAASNLPAAAGQAQNTSNAFQSGAMQGMTLGFGDEINAGLMTPIEMGIDLFQGKGFDPGRSFNQALAKNRALDQGDAALNPVANVAGQIGGGFVGPGAGLGWASKAKTVGQLALRGGAEGATLGGVYGFGSADGNLQDRLQGAAKGAAFGGVAGAVVPVLAKKAGDAIGNVLQDQATNAAIKGAPSAADLKDAARAMFKSVDQSGVTVDTNKFSQLVQSLVSQAKKDRINPNLDPKATGAYEEMIGALSDVQKNGGALTISDMHTLRQIAQKAAVSAEGRDSMFANRIVDALDNFVTSPGTMKLPPNQIGQGSNAAGNELLKAISTWGRARRTSLIENAIYKAGNAASGTENGLRIEFRKLLQNGKTRALFSKAEMQAIEKVANGTPISNAMRLLGHFGFDLGSGRNFLGGMVGAGSGAALGGPLGALAVGAAGTGARKAAQVMTGNAAERAARVVATPNIPNVKMPNIPMLPGTPFSFPMIDNQAKKPVSITIRGGSK